jgi:hypothetical protein
MFGKVERHGKVSWVLISFLRSLLLIPDLSCALLYLLDTLTPLHAIWSPAPRPVPSLTPCRTHRATRSCLTTFITPPTTPTRTAQSSSEGWSGLCARRSGPEARLLIGGRSAGAGGDEQDRVDSSGSESRVDP